MGVPGADREPSRETLELVRYVIPVKRAPILSTCSRRGVARPSRARAEGTEVVSGCVTWKVGNETVGSGLVTFPADIDPRNYPTNEARDFTDSRTV